ncbi:BHH_G0052750.mRNA.1.CDS.1 [Saccharomyces cerevisiae]|nr:BHH_G0052750.mRNA.1.CDS.1 [Saccharomyces cerevisiae]CAI7364235.1 BHH_G0052750.mRNA.1.CDS.1 [Saccharomyces cerevisiae]
MNGKSVTEVTGSNVVSVAEHVMANLVLIRNYNGGHQGSNGELAILPPGQNEYDLEDKIISTVGAGRIWYRVLEKDWSQLNPKKYCATTTRNYLRKQSSH